MDFLKKYDHAEFIRTIGSYFTVSCAAILDNHKYNQIFLVCLFQMFPLNFANQQYFWGTRSLTS